MSTKLLALVTGAGRTTGIGYEVCRQLGRAGFKVLLTARKLTDAQERSAELRSEGIDVDGHELDITSAESLQKIKILIESIYGKLDVLINNAAAVGPFGEKAASADLGVAAETLNATLFGNWRVTQAVLPLLRKSDHPRLVMVSSGAGSHGDRVFGLTTNNGMATSYSVAKAALNALTAKLAFEETNRKILINAVCPGFTATFEGGATMGARPVAEGAKSVVWAALLPDDGPTGGFFRDGKPLPW